MAKEKRDLDAELAALEAELAAVQSKTKAKKAPAPARTPAPEDDAPVAEALPAEPEPVPEKRKLGLPFGRKKKDEPIAAEPAPPAPEPKKKLGLPFGRKKKEERLPQIDQEVGPAPAPLARSEPEPQPEPQPPVASSPSGAWREESGSWVRSSQRQPPVVRRVLDEEDRVVREEPATRADVDAVTGVRAERGVGRILGRS